MCKFIGKSDEWIFCTLSKNEILRLYSIVHVAMETTKMSNFTCESKSFIYVFSTCHASACELQHFSCHNLANDIYSVTAKTVLSHLNHQWLLSVYRYPFVIQSKRLITVIKSGCKLALTFWDTNKQNHQLQTSCALACALLPGRKEAGPVWPTYKKNNKYFVKIRLRQLLTHSV